MAERRVLVLGATSLIGRRLMQGAWPEGIEVTALSRAPPSDADRRASWLATDLEDPDLAARLERLEADPASSTSALPGEGRDPVAETFQDRAADLGPGLRREERINFGRCDAQKRSSSEWPRFEAVLSLSPIWLLPKALPALIATGARRVVAVSSTSRLTKTESPVAAERAVARRLAEGEDALIAACDAAGIGWTILRPTMIYAEGEDANVTRLARLIARFGVLPLAGRGEGLRQPVHAADLAAAVWQVLDAPASAGRTYALPGGETLTYRAMAVRIFEALGRRARIVSVPPALWRLGLALAAPWLPGATSAMGERMARDLVFDAEPAARDFGYAPRPFRPTFPPVTKISRS